MSFCVPFFLSSLPIISLSPFFCPVVGMESVIEKQHCWNQLKKSLSSCGVKKPSLHWTLELAPFIHFSSPASSAGAGCPVGMLYPEDPLAAARHGGTSHLLNLDFLNLPAAWHIDKQPRFLAKVGNAHSLAVNCLVVLNHKTCSDSSPSKLPAMQAEGTNHTEVPQGPSITLWTTGQLIALRIKRPGFTAGPAAVSIRTRSYGRQAVTGRDGPPGKQPPHAVIHCGRGQRCLTHRVHLQFCVIKKESTEIRSASWAGLDASRTPCSGILKVTVFVPAQGCNKLSKVALVAGFLRRKCLALERADLNSGPEYWEIRLVFWEIWP